MCNCIFTIEEELGKTLQNPRIKIGFTFPDMKSFPIIEVEYDKPGKKKKYIQTILPTYCPFCGEKYKKEDN
jgi:hypothetical protein